MSLVGPLLPSLNVEEVPECERGGRWLWSDWSDEARGEAWGVRSHRPASSNRPPPPHFPVEISQDTLGLTGAHWSSPDQQYLAIIRSFMKNSRPLNNNYALEPLKISSISSLIAYSSLLALNPYYLPLPCLKVSSDIFFQSFWGES